MLIALSGRSQKNNYTRVIFGLYAYASGAQRQLIELLSHLGICSSYSLLTSNIKDPETHQGSEASGSGPGTCLGPDTTPSQATPLAQGNIAPSAEEDDTSSSTNGGLSDSDSSIWNGFE